MKYLLKHKDNTKYDSNDINFFDCPISLLNHFEQNKKDICIIDMLLYDKMDTIIIESIIKQIFKISPDHIIYIMNSNFNYFNTKIIESLDDISANINLG